MRPYFSALGREIVVKVRMADLNKGDRLQLLEDLLRSFQPEDRAEAREYAEKVDAILDGIHEREEAR